MITTRIILPSATTCPCGSRAIASSCCFRFPARGLRPPIPTVPAEPSTHWSHPACYASSLHDCSRKITGEHYFPEAILRDLKEHGDLWVEGPTWLAPGERRSLPPSALNANILCDRHNSALSRIDSEFRRIFRFLSLTEEDSRYPTSYTGEKVALFNGVDIERILLKLFLSRIASGSTPSQDGKVNFDRFFLPLVSLLFTRSASPLSPPLGFYVSEKTDPKDAHMGVAAVALAAQGELWGDMFTTNGLRMFMLARTPLPTAISEWCAPLHYRPQTIYLHGPSPRIICVNWPNQSPPVVLDSPRLRRFR